MADAKEAAAKGRIVKHMNADHATSLSLYLQHYCHIRPGAARGAQLEDIGFNSMTIRTKDGKTHEIAIEPPMASWSDARPRVVEMDRITRDALDISPIRITSYIPPTSFYHLTVFGLCLFAFVIFGLASVDKIVPGTWFYDTVLPYFPGGPAFFVGLAKTIGAPVVGIHALEAFYLDKSRLRKYGVEKGTKLWWAWIASCSIEGAGCFHRIDAEVKKKLLEAEKAKH